MPAVPPYIIEPIGEQFSDLLPERNIDHPLGCHHSRVPDRVVFEKLVQVLVFSCAYCRIADGSCSASTLRRRRDEWIEAGTMYALEGLAREAYDWMDHRLATGRHGCRLPHHQGYLRRREGVQETSG